MSLPTPLRHAPSPKDFDLSKEDLVRLIAISAAIVDNEAGISWADRLLPKEAGFFGNVIGGAFVVALIPVIFLGIVATPIIQFFRSILLERDPKFKNFTAFQSALKEFEKTKADYWRGLSGVDFEIQLAKLFNQIGYVTKVTSASGDRGIDILMEKASERVIVQCKQHAKPVGPATARELYGALMASNAERAILASISGFTPGVRSFTYNKPIQLMDVWDIIAIQDKLLDENPSSLRKH